MLHQSLQYSIDDIRLPIRNIFMRSTKFCKLSDNSHSASYEFLRNTNVRSVLADLGCGDHKMLKNVYTLTAIYTMDYDNEWQDIFNKQQYNLFEEHGEYILGYLVVHKKSDLRNDEAKESSSLGEGNVIRIEIDMENNCIRDTNYIHYIDYIYTRLRGYQLGALMIKYYEATFSYGSCPNGCIACLPYKMDPYSVAYWRKYLEKHNLFTSDDIRYIIKQYGIYGIVNWDLLITEYDNTNVTIWRK